MGAKRIFSVVVVLLVTLSLISAGFSSAFAVVGGNTRSAMDEARAMTRSEYVGTIVSATFTGVNRQIWITGDPAIGFPIDGPSYVIMSTGDARFPTTGNEIYDVESVAGIGGTSPFTEGDAYDVATLTIRLKVPEGARELHFKWRLVTFEEPDDGYFQDFFYAHVTFPDGKDVLAATFPGGIKPYVGVISEYMRPATSGDGIAEGAYVSSGVYTATVDVSGYAGKVITLTLQVGDVGDDIVDTAVFLDDLGFTIQKEAPHKNAYLEMLTLARIWTLRFFTFHDRFDELYSNATSLGVDNETLASALSLHKEAMSTLQAAWGNYNLSTIRRLMWSTMFMPKVGLVIKAYRMEMEAIHTLEMAIRDVESST